ncbi:MAG: ABC transporter ATP-binding protein [Elusimicrobiota bacterium]
MNSNSFVLELTDISKSFGNLHILKGASLQLKRGEIIAILGASGVGKSTLLHLAGLMEKPTSGEIFIDNEKVLELSHEEKSFLRLSKIGFLFQFHYLLPDFSALENVMIPARLANDNLNDAEKKARELLTKLGLVDRLSHRPYELSGGEQQRVAFARSMMRDPHILLCDEPTGNLDEASALDMFQLIRESVLEKNMAAIVVTHNEGLAKHTDKIYHLKEGKLV